MAKIKIEGCGKTDRNYRVHVVLTEPQQVEGRTEDVPIGEAFVSLPHDMDPVAVKGRIIEAAQSIMDAHKEAQAVRQKLQAVDWPDIT